MRSHDLGFYGKLPEFPDYVGFNTGEDTWREFANYLDEGFGLFRSRLASDLDSAYSSLPGLSFLMPPLSGERGIYATMVPSRDRLGRLYPFLTFHVISSRRGFEGIWPLYYENVDRQARAFTSSPTDRFIESPTQVDLIRRMLETVHLPPHSISSALHADVESWINETTIDSLWAHLVSHTANEGAPANPKIGARQLACQGAIEVLENRSPTWPLGPIGGPFGREIAFWIRVSQKLSGGKTTYRAMYWILRPKEYGVVRLCASLPSADLLFDFWMNAGNSMPSTLKPPRDPAWFTKLIDVGDEPLSHFIAGD